MAPLNRYRPPVASTINTSLRDCVFAMAKGNQGGMQAIFNLSARPQCEIVHKHDQSIDVEPDSLSTRVYVAECTNCQLFLKKKSANVLIENCQDLVLTMSAGLVSGTLEVVKSSNTSIKINPNIKIPTVTADRTKGLQIILLQNEQQIECLYFHDSSDLTIFVHGDNPECKAYHAISPENAPTHHQFISHWGTSESGIQLKTEKVVREGVFPHAEDELKEAKQKDRENAERHFNFLEKEYMKSKNT